MMGGDMSIRFRILCFAFTFGVVIAGGRAFAITEYACGHAAAAARMLAAHKGPVPKALEAWADTDVLNNDLNIEVVHATQNVSGYNRMTIQSLKPNLTEFTFRLANTFAISSIQLDGRTITSTRLDSITVRANFDQPVGLNQTFVLTINYGGPATAGAGFGSMIFTTQGGQPLDFTLSEPFYSYTWWPSKDDNNDKALNSIAVTVPNTMKVAANGRLIGTDVVAVNKLRYRYTCSYPMADYLLMFAATNYNEWSLTYNFSGGSMPVRFMIWPGSDSAANRTAWGKCVSMLAAYEPIFGPYPFRNDQYGIYQFSFGGGMEHQTFTGQGTFDEGVTAHELGHQWWGDMVTCRYWQDIWLNEGFATYVEALWDERKPGSSGLPALKASMASKKPTQFSGSVYRTDITNVNSIFSTNYTYRKGGWVLHMYRHVVGDTLFFQTLANWRAQFQYASATTQDFIAVAEATAGQDLNWFFDPWVFQIGGVRYSLGSQNIVVNGQNYLLLKVGQVQNGTYPTYRMPVDVRFVDSAGTQTRVIVVSASTQWYAIRTTGAASGISLDPDGWILTTGSTTAATFTAGPPKIVSVTPAPGNASDGDVSQLKVTFHTAVNLSSSSFALFSREGTPIPFGYRYDATTKTATLDPAYDGDFGGYRLVVSDSITAIDSGMSLDGEVGGPTYALPSGDGLPGGQAEFRFGY